MINNRPRSRYVRKQEARKEIPYTVTTIGGANELALWKKDRERIEAEYQLAVDAKRRGKAIDQFLVLGMQPALPFRDVFVPPTLTQKIQAWASKLWRTAFPQ